MTSNGDEREINNDETERMKAFLQGTVPRIPEDARPDRDLWPAMLRRMDEEATRGASVPWWDWALVSGLVAFVVVVLCFIPVIFYYL